MDLRLENWVLVRGRDLGPGRISRIIGKYFMADFLVEDGVECCPDLIPVADIEKVVTDKKEVKVLENEFWGQES